MSFTDAPVPDDHKDEQADPSLAIADPTIVSSDQAQAETKTSETPDVTSPDSTHQTPDAPAGEDRPAESVAPGSSPGPSGPAVAYPGNSAAPTRAVERPIQPVRVDGRNRRSADDGLEGNFVRIVNGEHKGRVGAFLQTLETAADGYPKRILVRTRDEFDELLTLAYEDVKHTSYKGGR